MLVSEDKIREELKKVIDPELFVNIVDLGLIYNIEISESNAESVPSDDESPAAETAEDVNKPAEDVNKQAEATTSGDDSGANPADEPYDGPLANVAIEMTMTSPACPAGPQLLGGSKNVVSRMKEVQEVEVKLVMDPPWTPDRMTEDARDQLGIF